MLLREISIDVDHLVSLFESLLAGGVGGVPLLPEELGSAEEETGAHLPTDHIGPLVAEDRQIAVRLNPILVSIPDNRLGSGAHDELLLEFGIGIDHHAAAVGIVLQTVVGDHRALLGESFHMAGLATKEGFRNKNREIGVGMACIFKHLVQLTLHFLPNRISVGLDHHTTAHGGVLRQVRFLHNVVIPLRIILCSCTKIFCHKLLYKLTF